MVRRLERNRALVRDALAGDARAPWAAPTASAGRPDCTGLSLRPDRPPPGIAAHYAGLLALFDLDPRRSALWPRLPELLTEACDPRSPVLYHPAQRAFALIETWGPSVRAIAHCPWTGAALPPALTGDWYAMVDARLGHEDWSIEALPGTVPEDWLGEGWWLSQGL